MSQNERRLAAIMFTDIVGYTALGQENESAALELLERHRQLLRPLFSKHAGREIKTMGDAFLVEFGSALEATLCAVDVQSTIHSRNLERGEKLQVRVGIHVGDVVHQGGDVLGDAVNIASRIEPLAEPGGVCISGEIYAQVRNKLPYAMNRINAPGLKNVKAPIDVYRVVLPWQQQVSPTETTSLPRDRIAVLPFANMSPDPNDEFFADGLTEELTDRLCQIGGLRVLSRTSVMCYKGEKKNAAQIGKELKAGALVEGSVRKEGNKVRVTAQLIDANTEEHLWSSKYDRDLAGIFEVQSDVAERVADTLKVHLLAKERGALGKKTANDPEAYALCMKGRHYLKELTMEGIDKALGYFQEALKIEPTCALALASIGECYHFRGDWAYSAPRDAYPKTVEYAQKALEIDPDLAEGHAALGAAYFHYEWKWREAEEELAKAVGLKPSDALARNEYATVFLFTGRLEESYTQIKMAYELDPLFVSNGFQCGWTALLTGRMEEGMKTLKETAAEHPESPDAHVFLGLAYYQCSRAEEAISEVRKALEVSGGHPFYKGWMALICALTGHREEASSILSELTSIGGETFVGWVTACVLYILGRDDEAFMVLEQECRRRSGLTLIRWFPFMAELRKDPRWVALEIRMGLSGTSTS